MLEQFLNPGYLAIGGALVSAPIIIHLINRMRFKRLRWAAMEFLLKSQKRNRRRLIIEQLILLALRCLLVLLAALLVLRFVGLSLADFQAQEALHIVLLDDGPSMTDRWKEGNEQKNCFKVAKNDVILGSIVKGLGQSSTNERLVIIPLSDLVTKDQLDPTFFQKLNDGTNEKKVKEYLESLKPSNVHVDLVQGVETARRLFGEHPEWPRHVLHIVSDFRQVDWNGPDSEGLHKALQKLNQAKVKIRLTDTVGQPNRLKGQGGPPQAHDNLAIIDMRASTRVVGKGMPVTFKVTVANYGSRDEQVKVVIVDESSGRPRLDIDFSPNMPLRISPDSTASATFEMREFPNIGPNDKFYALRLSAHLESAQSGPLENDGLAIDNLRHAAVEIRNKVPVLLIDGKNKQGREENGDSFFIERAIASVPGASYEVVNGDELTAASSVVALERSDLSQYPTIFLLNVPELNNKQLTNLENYVRDGGGVAFFLGPQVKADYYNKKLHRLGQGIFPVPLRSTFFPPNTDGPRKGEYTGDYQLRVRSDLFGNSVDSLRQVPIFGDVFRETKLLNFLKDLNIGRWFPVPRGNWKPEPGRVFELATLPNEQPVTGYQAATVAILEQVEKLLAKEPELKRFGPGLERHGKNLRAIVAPGSELRAYKLAEALELLLTDQGRKEKPAEFPNLTEFWSSANPKVRSLQEEVRSVRDLVLYGDPFVIAQRFGKGRVVAVMSTAGKEWNDWGGGSEASVIFQPFIWEMQNWLSSQAADSDLTVGTPIKIDVDAVQLKAQGKPRVKIVRTWYKPVPGDPAVPVEEADTFPTEAQGVLTFSFPRTFEPGFYKSELYSQDDAQKRNPLAAWGHTFNIDAQREGKLKRLSQDDFEKSLGIEGLQIEPPPQGVPQELVNRQSDLSESAWFFLVFLAVLVAEQALAVHLSFHLRGAEGELPLQVLQSQARVA
jgi:hypothetical protein